MILVPDPTGAESKLNYLRISSYLQRIDALRWTPYLDECLQMLAEKQEYPADTFLVHQVKLQLIVEKVSQAPWHDGLVDSIDSMKVPPAFYLKALRAQLRDFKQNIPPELQQNGKLSYIDEGSDENAYTLRQRHCSCISTAQSSPSMRSLFQKR